MSSTAQCFHCDNPVPTSVNLTVRYGETQVPVCCHGCQAVADLLLNDGLEEFYRYKTDQLEIPEPLTEEESQELALYDRPEFLSRVARSNRDNYLTVELSVGGITCAACVWLLENYIKRLPGVEEFWVNLSNHRAELTWHSEEASLSGILASFRNIGFSARPYSPSVEQQRLNQEQRSMLIRLGIAGIGMMQSMMLAIPMYLGLLEDSDRYVQLFRYISLVIATPVVIYSAQPFFRNAIRDLRHRHLTMDVPVSLAIGGAYCASAWITVTGGEEVYFDSVSMFTFFLLMGRYLESRARLSSARTDNALASPLQQFVLRVEQNGDSEFPPPERDPVENLQSRTQAEEHFYPTERVGETYVEVTSLQVGDVIKVLAGGYIPIDGTVIKGTTSVNEAAINGEFLPQTRRYGDKVLSGSINVENTVWVRVEKVLADSQVATIDRLVSRAVQDKPQLSAFADKVASWFVAGVILTATVVGFAWWQIEPSSAFAVTLSVLVVTCPCALSLATPTALTVAATALKQAGLVITRGNTIETLAHVDRVAFDKTGTLTQGELELNHPFHSADELGRQYLSIATALEAESTHPIAKAFKVQTAESASDIVQYPGQGIAGNVGGCEYRIGTFSFVSQGASEGTDEFLQFPEAAPGTLRVFLGSEKKVLTCFDLQDQIRPSAPTTVGNLVANGVECAVVSGDPSDHVQYVAEQAGISETYSGVSPAEKLRMLSEWQRNGYHVAMVGDGINDVPAMAASHLSIAMQNATDLTQMQADALLLNSNLNTIHLAQKKARKTLAIIRQNVGWAIGYNVMVLPLAAFGLIPPWAAALGMSTSSLVVVGNAMRLRKPLHTSQPE